MNEKEKEDYARGGQYIDYGAENVKYSENLVKTVSRSTSFGTREGFKVTHDDRLNPPSNVAEGLFTVLITTPKNGYVHITVDEAGEIVKINDVNVKGRLFAI